jgi:hypothetical protein
MDGDQPGKSPTWEASMSTSAHMQRPIVTEMSQTEWNAAVKRTLDRLHLTYDQLKEMAARRDFPSLDAKKLWLAIGEQDQGQSGRPD